MVTILKQVSEAYAHAFFGIAENKVRDKPLERGLNQSIQLEMALHLLELANQALKVPYAIPKRTFTLLSYAPLAIGVAKSQDTYLSPDLKNVVHVVHEYTGSLAKVISLVSAVALLALNQYRIAGLSLGFMALAYAVEKEMLPKPVIQKIENVGLAAILIVSSWTMRFLIMIEPVGNYMLKPWQEMKALQSQPITPPTSISAESLSLTKAHIYFDVKESDDQRNQVLRRLREIRETIVKDFLSEGEDFLANQNRNHLHAYFGVNDNYAELPCLVRWLFEGLYGDTFWKRYEAEALAYFDRDSISRPLLVHHRILEIP